MSPNFDETGPSSSRKYRYRNLVFRSTGRGHQRTKLLEWERSQFQSKEVKGSSDNLAQCYFVGKVAKSANSKGSLNAERLLLTDCT
jgi:hypothetical protein